MYQGGGVTRSAAIQNLVVTQVTLTWQTAAASNLPAAVFTFFVTQVTDLRQELIQNLCSPPVTFMTARRPCLIPHFAKKLLCIMFFTKPT